MLKNFLKITFRSLVKNKLFVFINVVGMGIALACCIVAYLNWDFNNQFDTYHEDTDHVYRVNFTRITNGRPVNNGSCPLPLGPNADESIAQIDDVIRYYPVGGNFKVDNELFRTWISAVDPSFFETFTFNMLAGNTAQMQDKRTILINSELAQKHFPDTPDPVGEIMTYIQGDERIEFQIGGVFEKHPLNSSFYFTEAFIHYDNAKDIEGWNEDNWAFFNNTFVTVNNPDDVPEVEAQLQNFVEVQNRAKEDYKVQKYYLDPFVGMAVRAEREGLWNHWFQQSLPVAAATAPGIMAILILPDRLFQFHQHFNCYCESKN